MNEVILEKLDKLPQKPGVYMMKDAIGRILGERTAVLDGGAGTARQTKRCLEQAGLLNDGPGSVTIENSKHAPQMLELCQKLLEV